MTRLWAEGDPVEVVVHAGTPVQFQWRGEWHEVSAIANRWRVRSTWWMPSVEAWREYVKLTTVDGLLLTLFHDLRADAWYCARVYD